MLKAYKDTGLEPCDYAAMRSALDQAQEAKQQLSDIVRILGCYDIDHLNELIQAEKDRRMVVLPCKVGETVWITSSYMRQHIPPIVGNVVGFEVIRDKIMDIQVLIWADLGEGKKKYGFDKKSFGKIIFLSREEAEAALKK